MKDKRIWIADIIGLVATLSLLGGGGWYVFAKPDTASARMAALAGEVAQLNTDRIQLQSVQDQFSRQRRDLLEHAKEMGRLPDDSPLDQELKRITNLAGANDIKILEVTPLAVVRYPNVLSTQFSLKTEGTFADYVQFFESYEQSESWSDMTHIAMAPANPGGDATNAMRRGELTVSFFSLFQ